MKIEISSKIKDLIQGKFSLKKKDKYYDAFIFENDEALTSMQYFFVYYNDGTKALYSYPSFKLLSGEDKLAQKELQALDVKHYKTRGEYVRGSAVGDIAEKTLHKYQTDEQTKSFGNNTLRKAFEYLESLYDTPRDELKEYFEQFFSQLRRECDNLGIIYETIPSRILNKHIDRINEISRKESPFYIDLTPCKSLEEEQTYFEERKASCSSEKDKEDFARDMNLLKTKYIFCYPGVFLSDSYVLQNALNDKNYPNRSQILKKFMEFFIASPEIFQMTKQLDEQVSLAADIEIDERLSRLKSNHQFMEELRTMLDHDQNEETYLFHATTDLENANKILNEGFYMYSRNPADTTYQELSEDQVLSYSYGDNINEYKDFIIVLGRKKDEDVVRELSPEERELAEIVPRRIGIVGQKPSHIIDKEYVIGYIDKKNEEIHLNPEYKYARNNEK